MPDQSTLKARNWTFTLNNYTPRDIERLAKPYDEVKYVAYSHEVAPTTGTPHLQGFVCMWEPCRLKFFEKYIPRGHMQVMHGRLLDNERYCSKSSELIEIGERPAQGRRTDLISVKRKLEEGVRPMELAEEENFFPHIAKYDKFFHKYAEHIRAKRLKADRDMPEVYIRIGDAGTGKTRWCDEHFGIGNWVFAPDNKGQWFDGCDNSDVVVFDDVEAGQIPPLSLWKRLTDRYPMQVPIKGGFITWKPRAIIFTSNYPPSEWWPNLSEFDKNAIERRATEITVVS